MSDLAKAVQKIDKWHNEYIKEIEHVESMLESANNAIKLNEKIIKEMAKWINDMLDVEITKEFYKCKDCNSVLENKDCIECIINTFKTGGIENEQSKKSG